MARKSYDMQPKRTFPTCVCSCGVSAFLILGGSVLFLVWPLLFNYILESNLVLAPNTHTYDLWKKFPMDLPIDFYFFNWTNPEDAHNSAVKPRFNEMGPYRFLETKEKANVTWNSNGTVSFRHLKRWYYNTNGANRDLQDVVTTINPVAVSAAYAARSWSILIRKGLSVSLSTIARDVNISRTVSQLLFEGYSDPLIDMAQRMPFLAGNALPPWDRFGWFYTRNGSTDFEGYFNMGTGEKNTEFGRLYEWNYWNQTPYYRDQCGAIGGSAGEFYPPNPGKGSLVMFSPDLCRTITLEYLEEVVVNNILGYKYVMGANMFDNGTKIPENKCYCGGECTPSGTVNVSSCRYGSPSFASLPHFYNADPYYVDIIEGLKADPEKHQFYLVLEPTTGIPLQVKARLQINLLLQPIPGVSLFENVPRVFVPMLWFEQSVQIPDSEARLLKLLLNLPVICISLGILLVCMGLVLASCIIYKACTTNICGRTKKANFLYEEQHVPLQSNLSKEMEKKP